MEEKDSKLAFIRLDQDSVEVKSLHWEEMCMWTAEMAAVYATVQVAMRK